MIFHDEAERVTRAAAPSRDAGDDYFEHVAHPMVDVSDVDLTTAEIKRSAQTLAGYACAAGVVASAIHAYLGLAETVTPSELMQGAAFTAAAVVGAIPFGKIVGGGLMAGALNAYRGPAAMFKAVLENAEYAVSGRNSDLLDQAEKILMKEGREANSYLVVVTKWDGSIAQRKLQSEAEFERLQQMAAKKTNAVVRVQEPVGGTVVERVYYQGQLDSLEAGRPAVRVYDHKGEVVNEEWYSLDQQITPEYAARCIESRASAKATTEADDYEVPADFGMA